jgi:hypothetical protein
MTSSIYHSYTHGAIPLSPNGKRLMRDLRNAIQDAIQKRDYNHMNAVAHARGELASYLRELEKMKTPVLSPTGRYITDAQTLAEAQKVFSRKWLIQGKFHDDHELFYSPPQNEEPQMSNNKVAVATKKKKVEIKFRPIGVRFLTGHNLGKIYHYRIRKAAKVHLGQELVVSNDSGISVVVVVTVDGELPMGYPLENLATITSKVATL